MLFIGRQHPNKIENILYLKGLLLVLSDTMEQCTQVCTPARQTQINMNIFESCTFISQNSKDNRTLNLNQNGIGYVICIIYGKFNDDIF